MWEEVKSNLPEFKPFDRFLYVGEKSKRQRKEPLYDIKSFEKFKDNVKAIGGPGIIGSTFSHIFL